MNNILGETPIKGSSKILDKEFGKWWLFLNNLGIFSFLIAISVHGSNHEQGKSIAALILFTWLYLVGKDKMKPRYVSKVTKGDSELAKKINQEYLHSKYMVTAYLPFTLGCTYLAGIAGKFEFL